MFHYRLVEIFNVRYSLFLKMHSFSGSRYNSKLRDIHHLFCLELRMKQLFFFSVWLWLVVGLSPIVRLWDLGLLVECPPWGSFEVILIRIYVSFGINHGKLRKPRLTSATGTSRLPVLSAELLGYWWCRGTVKKPKAAVAHTFAPEEGRPRFSKTRRVKSAF